MIDIVISCMWMLLLDLHTHLGGQLLLPVPVTSTTAVTCTRKQWWSRATYVYL